MMPKPSPKPRKLLTRKPLSEETMGGKPQDPQNFINHEALMTYIWQSAYQHVC